uniref:Uncharacterized protein n=1 Tax=Arundo donax TaxID=35708 RepID=A0A0A9H3G0_ARUDO
MPVSFDWNTPLLKWPQPKVKRRVEAPPPSCPKVKRSVASWPMVRDLSP